MNNTIWSKILATHSKQIDELQENIQKCVERLDFNDEDIEECIEQNTILRVRSDNLRRKVRHLTIAEGITSALVIGLIVRSFKR